MSETNKVTHDQTVIHITSQGLSAASKLVNKLAFENGRMRFLIGEAITYMSHAEKFIKSREKMHPTGVQQWGELIDRLREVMPLSGGPRRL